MLDRLLDEARAVLFDFDGVIVDSEPFYYKSYNKAFEKRGHSIKEEDYWEYWTSRGEGIPGEAKRHGIDLSEEEIAVMYAERRLHYTEFCRQGKIPFYKGMVEALHDLKDKGKPCAIASSSFENDVITIFEKAGHENPPCVVIGRRAGLRPKPKPDIFVYAAGVLKTAPADCLVIEDAHKGLEAAAEVGMRCVILKNERNSKLDYPGAELVVESHKEFVAAVDAWQP
jgi:HAD superfamily hydrolase (TIGR01509 family)